MEDPAFKLKYQKYKNKVKLWEKEFKQKRGRIPSKHDIRDASIEIKQAYKMYYKLKTSILEDTLSDVLSEDGFELLDNSQNESLMEGVIPMDLNFELPPIGLDKTQETSPTDMPFSNLSDIRSAGKSIENITNIDENHVIKHFEAVEHVLSNDVAWGPEVSNKAKLKENSPVKQKFKSSLSTKLFANTSFAKRNPRKSLSGLNSEPLKKNTSLNSSDSKDILPDLETILSQKSQTKSKEVIQGIPTLLAKPMEVVTNVDIGWLNRCSGNSENISSQQQSSKAFGISNLKVENIGNIASTPGTSFGMSQLAIDGGQTTLKPNTIAELIENKYGHDSDSVVSNSEDESSTSRRVARHVIKKRKLNPTVSTEESSKTQALPSVEIPKTAEKIEPKPKISPVQDTPRKSTRSTTRNKKQINYQEEEVKKDSKKSQNDEDFNSLTEDETPKKKETKRKSQRGKKSTETKVAKTPSRASSQRSKKVQIDENENQESAPFEPHIDVKHLKSLPRIDMSELKNVDAAVQKYLDTGPILVNSAKSAVESNLSKRAAVKKKLEDKIVAGKLNENFVRINMKKKIFVRGKKTVNYSRYKKTQWRHKKAAALSGPDMDMGGCDGGKLTCFTCGKVGHFARNCKVKGDQLLPLDSHVVDDSPFPTLEEAERMAGSQALAAHSRNIEKMPEVGNSHLLETQDSDAEDKIQVDEEVEDIPEEVANELADESGFQSTQTYVGHKIPDDFLKKAGLLDLSIENNDKVVPLYKQNSDGSLIKIPEEVDDALRMFGHKNFRKGQDRAIMRILSGLSTLVTLSTGSGKSLCYQLPAYLYSKHYHCITLVISPLVSLMEDQVHGVPGFLNAQCLHTNQSPVQKEKVMTMIKEGKVHVLLVSPEAVVAGERSTGFGSLLRKLPPIAFACIDEAHCVSQWSHNFRPSYLMICKVLKQKLGVKTILGLTATATLPTRTSIIRHLNIHDGLEGIISDIPLPDNLILSVSKDFNRDAGLVKLLRSKRFAECQSIIIYCTRRDECERIASFIRTCLQDVKPDELNTKKRKRVNWNAESYHAGMPASRRRTIQNAFMRNELRIVVATIAFGMGINKPDIRAVIHYNMPRNFESYVQEVGRAGRDGKLSHCHLFLESKGTDKSELERHIYANSIDRHVIRKLLQKVFIPCACKKNLKEKKFVTEYANEIQAVQNIDWNEEFECEIDNNVKEDKQTGTLVKRSCPGHEVAFSIESTVEELDIPEENISTLLCYLELDGRFFVQILSNAYTMCKVFFYGGARLLKQSAKECPPLAMAIALANKKGNFDDQKNVFEFSVIEIASAIGWDSGVVKYQLKNLEWATVDGVSKRSSLSVNFFDLGFRIRAPGDLSDEELDETLDILYNRSVQQEKTQLIQLQYVFDGLSSVAQNSCANCESTELCTERSDELKKTIRSYFQNDYPKDIILRKVEDSSRDSHIIDDVRTMINMYPENTFTGRTMARIFHGIQSPNFPAVIWGRCKFWRAHSKGDFNRIVQLANSVIVKMRLS